MQASVVSMIVATAVFACLGLFIWFLVRRQKQRFWLPILQVIPLESTVLPKLRWNLPPLWSFICFFVSVLAIAIYSFQFVDPLMKTADLELPRTHLYFDLSPSNSTSLSIADYTIQAEKIIEGLTGKTRLSFSVSSEAKIYAESDSAFVLEAIKKQGFHRAGLKLGTSIEKLLKQLKDLDQLIIVGDRDAASWEDFNWRYLEKKLQVAWYSVVAHGATLDNVFIDGARPKLAEGSGNHEIWIVELRRVGDGKGLQGKLSVEFEGRVLFTQDWAFDPLAKNIEIEVNLAQFGLQQQNVDQGGSLVWTIAPSVPDVQLADNTFRSWIQRKNQVAQLIARPRGEMFLEDSVFHLKSSLEILGYQVQRRDEIEAQDMQASRPSLIVSEVGPMALLKSFCPIDVANRNSKARPPQDISVWLVPGQDLSDYGELCACYAALAQAPKPLIARPPYCENIEHRDQYVRVLQSIGALQLGGTLGSSLDAIAMSLRNRVAGLRILGFTIDLNPMRQGQVSYGQLPLMLRDVLTASGAKANQNLEKQELWPRIDDISSVYDAPYLALSNVPMQESLGRQIGFDQLPPQLTIGTKGLIQEKARSGAENDARPWIYLCLLLLVISVWLDILGIGAGRLFKKYPSLVRWFGLFLGLVLVPHLGLGAVQLNLLGYESMPKLSAIRRDVAGRTSIDLDLQPLSELNYNPLMLRQPWLWVDRPQLLESLDKTEFTKFANWLQRGGFLVVEKHSGSEKLKSSVLEAAPTGVWKPIPPDHELMRSFHLLASLPQCGNQVWEGFHFDQRIAVVLIPGDFLRYVLDEKQISSCFAKFSHEQAVRVFVNLLMVSLATDYKKDQIHLPEILKRLR